MTNGALPELFTQLMSPEITEDPYPFYAQLRGYGGLAGLQPGIYAATSFTAVDAVLRAGEFAVASSPGNSMLDSNPPEHTRMRRLFAGAFTPRRIDGLRTAIEVRARELAGAMKQDDAADLMSGFAYRLPVAVICELLGIPAKDREWFRSVASDVTAALEFTMTEQQQLAHDSAIELLFAYFGSLAEARRRYPEDDLISDVAASEALSGEELLRNLVLLLIAGFETTTSLLGNGMLVLLREREWMARLREDPGLAEAYVEEFLRFDSPVQLTSRVALRPVTVDGVAIEPGAAVVALIGAANRDPGRFERAEEFDPGRAGNTSLSFGAGAHFCLGNALARMEARIAFPLLLKEFAGIELAGEPVRRPRLVLRGLESLPVRWHG